MDRIHRFMMTMLASFPEPDNVICIVVYITLVSCWRKAP